MGTFTVGLEIGDLAAIRFETAKALVDTGAVYSFVPEDLLGRLGLEPREIRQLWLADERVVEYGFGYATLRFEGKEILAPIIFAPEDAMPLLGATALEIALLGVDPYNEQLVPVMGLLKQANGSSSDL